MEEFLVFTVLIIGVFLVAYYGRTIVIGLTYTHSTLFETSVKKGVKKTTFDKYESFYFQETQKNNKETTYEFLFKKSHYPLDLRIDKTFSFLYFCKPDGEFIKPGDPICEIFIRDENTEGFEINIIISSQEGYLEHVYVKEEDEKLKTSVVLFRIHNKGVYENENVPENSSMKYYYHKHYDNFPDMTHHSITIYVDDGQRVEIGDELFNLESTLLGNQITKKQITIRAEKEGFVDIYNFDFSYDHVKNNSLILTINDTDKNRINRKYVNIPNVVTDEFTGNKNITWFSVSGDSLGIISYADDESISLQFSFCHLNNSDYIFMYFSSRELKPEVNDRVQFLFENGQIIDFSVLQKPKVLTVKGKPKLWELKFPITRSDLEVFSNEDFRRWKVIVDSLEREYLGGETGEYQYAEKHNLVIAIKKFTQEFVNIVNHELSDHSFLELASESESKSINTESCYVYLMKDLANSFYKIGISNNPDYREGTLQSEKPTIELVAKKKFPVRKIAESFEKALHNAYSSKRIRGEWFNLNEVEASHVIDSLE